jgi:hypothetical protein
VIVAPPIIYYRKTCWGSDCCSPYNLLSARLPCTFSYNVLNSTKESINHSLSPTHHRITHLLNTNLVGIVDVVIGDSVTPAVPDPTGSWGLTTISLHHFVRRVCQLSTVLIKRKHSEKWAKLQLPRSRYRHLTWTGVDAGETANLEIGSARFAIIFNTFRSVAHTPWFHQARNEGWRMWVWATGACLSALYRFFYDLNDDASYF